MNREQYAEFRELMRILESEYPDGVSQNKALWKSVAFCVRGIKEKVFTVDQFYKGKPGK